MLYPSDVLLHSNAKSYGFIDIENPINTHWDLTWSFTFALTGIEHAFCTFLTTTPTISSAIPGQYLGYLDNVIYLTDETNKLLLTEDNNRILLDPTASPFFERSGLLAIAFDSTGYFALSNTTNSGVGINGIKRNSLIIRDVNNDVILNESLSSLSTEFFLSSSIKNYQTLRFRFLNGDKKLYIDYKKDNGVYVNMTSLLISSFNTTDNTIVYNGLTFCSPLSSSSIIPSTLYIKNFNVNSYTNDPTIETIPMIPLVFEKIDPYFNIDSIRSLSSQ